MTSKRKHDDNETDKANVLMVGTGEYTTGYVGGTAADSDKGAGVVALTMFDLRRRGKVARVGMCGVNVSRFSLSCFDCCRLEISHDVMQTHELGTAPCRHSKSTMSSSLHIAESEIRAKHFPFIGTSSMK